MKRIRKYSKYIRVESLAERKAIMAFVRPIYKKGVEIVPKSVAHDIQRALWESDMQQFGLIGVVLNLDYNKTSGHHLHMKAFFCDGEVSERKFPDLLPLVELKKHLLYMCVMHDNQ